MATTTNYGWTLPEVLGSSGAWGSILNETLESVDEQVAANAVAAAAALPKAGGTMTGRVNLETGTVARVDKGTVSSAQSLDLDTAQAFRVQVGGPLTLSFTNPPAANTAMGFLVKLVNGGSATITWPASVKWAGGSAPAFTTVGTDLVGFVSDDAGVTWHGFLISADSR